MTQISVITTDSTLALLTLFHPWTWTRRFRTSDNYLCLVVGSD